MTKTKPIPKTHLNIRISSNILQRLNQYVQNNPGSTSAETVRVALDCGLHLLESSGRAIEA